MYIYFGVMAVAAVAMWHGMNKFRTDGAVWGRPVAGVCGVVVIACAIMVIYGQFHTAPPPGLLRFQEIQRQKMEYLGQYIAQKHPNANAVLVKEFMMGGPEATPDIFKEGLVKGLGTAVKVIDERQTTPDMMMGTGEGETSGQDAMAEFVDKVAKEAPTANVIIVTSGFPINLNKVKYPEKAKAGFPMLYLISGAQHLGLAKALLEGKFVGACVLDRRTLGEKPDDKAPLPKTPKEVFDQNFVMITAENYAQFEAQFNK